MMTNQPPAPWFVFVLSLLLVVNSSTLGQRAAPKPTPLPDDQLPAFATSLVISIATEARSFSDLALRPRVMAQAADVLWDVDNVTARSLFKRAWDEAEKGDKEEVTINTKDKPPAMVTAMRRMSGRDLRFEVLNMMAKRDLALSEEYFAKLQSQHESEKESSKNSPQPKDDWLVPEAVSKRLQVASSLLKNGQTDKAIEFAAPVLNEVNSHTINFLSELRYKNPEAADRMYARLLGRAEADAQSDANTVSGLSSYVFTPGFYVTFEPGGGARWSQGDEAPKPPENFPPALRDKFFQVGAGILLRPLPQSDSEARNIKWSAIKRMLPLFDRYAPDTAAALRAQLIEMSSSGPSRDMGQRPFGLTEEIRPAPSADGALEQMQNRIDRARTPRERDSIYAFTAAALLDNGDERARDIAGKIENLERRNQLLQHIDFEFIQLAIKKKQATKAIRLIQGGRLSNTQRAAAYIDVAQLLRETDRQRSLELLEDAVQEVNRIERDKPDRAVLLVGIANQLIGVDRVRAWEIIGEVVKEANRFDGYTGENTLTFPLMTGNSITTISIGGENFSVAKIFRALAKDDLYRAVDAAKSFKYDAPRAVVTLAIATSILEKK